jgi:ABC-type uncharacterized transport system substrate-binding protein
VAARGARAAGGDAGGRGISASRLSSHEFQRRTRHMHRRNFLRFVSATAVCPCVAAAESAKKRPVIGILAQGTPAQLKGLRFRQSFLDGMQALGYFEGRDFDIVARAAESTGDLPRVAKDLVRLNPDVILAGASAHAVAAKLATSMIPIVVPALGNPIALGLIETDARPGGNLTGIMPYIKGLPAKQLELAREIVPRALKIGIVNNSSDVKAIGQWDEIEAVTPKLDIKIASADVRKPEDIDRPVAARTGTAGRQRAPVRYWRDRPEFRVRIGCRQAAPSIVVRPRLEEAKGLAPLAR